MTAAGRGQEAMPRPPGPPAATEVIDPESTSTEVAPAAVPLPAPPSRSTPLLLQGQDYYYRSPSTCLDFQERVHEMGLVEEDGGDPLPCVLVLARAADMEMNELSLALAERGIRMVRIDADRCLNLPLTIYTDAPLVELDLRLLRPILVWRRHFDISAVPVDQRTISGAYAADQWRSVINWLAQRTDWEHVNPTKATCQLDRLTQLSDAASFGLKVPRTAVTTQPGRTRPGGGRCIVKTAGQHLLEPRPGALHGLFPRPLDTSRAGDSPESAPVIVQQFLNADGELRVFVVDDKLISYRVEKLDPAQLWVDPDAVKVTRAEIPAELADKLRALARHWNVQVAAFDLLLVDGDHVFLEINVSCDWRWFEHRAGSTEVSDAVHDWVAGRFAALLDARAGL